ncbi:hypothetical protein [Hyphococcus sp.]|uniref:hypothetical protein n=1 Tax=Hyphococcus sp. TaxID=2038636 RepID=UPI0035C68BFE
MDTLYRMIKVLWPHTISVTDGVIYDQKRGLFPTLSNIWEKIEISVPYSDHWRQLGVFAFFQALHEEAIRARSMGRVEIKSSEIGVARFDYYLRRSLESEDWRLERRIYEKSNAI